MGAFIVAVQNSDVRQPTQHGFRLQDWKFEFERLQECQADQKLYETGCWTHNCLEGVRSALFDLRMSEFPVERLELAVGYLNAGSAFLVSAALEGIESLNGERFFGLQEHSIVRELESHINSGRFLLADLMRPECGERTLAELPDALEMSYRLARAYDWYEYSWLQSLWRGWSVSLSETRAAFACETSLAYERIEVGNLRFQELIGQGGMALRQNWAERSEGFKQALDPFRRISSAVRKKGRYRFSVPPWKATDEPSFIAVSVSIAQYLYPSAIESQVVAGEDLTVGEMLSAWALLSSFAEVLSARLPEWPGRNTPGHLRSWCQRIRRSDLIRLIEDNSELTRVKAKRVLARLTFEGFRTDLWLRPVIPLGPDHVGFVLHGLTLPNLLRSIEDWVKADESLFSERGFDFERTVAQELWATRRIPGCFITRTPVNFVAGGKSEELDLMIAVGSTLLVAEVKCTIFPSSPIEEHNYLEVIEGAREQAARKAVFVGDHLDDLKATFPNFDAVRRVQPLVVSNLPHGTGSAEGEVPVVDPGVLSRYFVDGEVVIGASWEQPEDGTSHRLWDSRESAEENMMSYLTMPTQITLFRSLMTTGWVRQPFVDCEGRVIDVRGIRLDVPDGPIEDATPDDSPLPP